MGMLSATGLTGYKLGEVEFGLVRFEPRSFVVGRREAEDVNFPAQQDLQDRELDISA